MVISLLSKMSMLKEKTPNYVNNVNKGFAAVCGDSDNHNQGVGSGEQRG